MVELQPIFQKKSLFLPDEYLPGDPEAAKSMVIKKTPKGQAYIFGFGVCLYIYSNANGLIGHHRTPELKLESKIRFLIHITWMVTADQNKHNARRN
jgi:hypothetical protein